jgi:DeoR family ulaG and ulaABCDEF operon transcriptional repressor
MHAAEREKLILQCLEENGFVSFRDLDAQLAASPATIRRDLERLAGSGRITRVRGGAKKHPERDDDRASRNPAVQSLVGVPFHENIGRNLPAKRAIGKAAAQLCSPGESVMIDGGSTTLQMAPHLGGLRLQVLTNSLHIMNALLPQTDIRLIAPAGEIFREQNIILSVAGDDGLPRLHAPKLFMGAASIGPQGLMQADSLLAAAERRLIDRAETIIVLIDRSKFDAPSGHIVCALEEIDVIVTESNVTPEHVSMLEGANIRLITANAQPASSTESRVSSQRKGSRHEQQHRRS